jgi:uncharacterized cupredoxin-like copper-binding protein
MAQARAKGADLQDVTEPGRTPRHRRVATTGRLVATLLVAVAAAACSRSDATPRGTLVAVHESDFKLTTWRLAVPTGYVTFRIKNTGPSTHEFIVVRSDVAADALPLRANGMTVNEDSKLLHPAGELGEIRLNSTRNLTLNLEPGHYALFCNLEGHYRGGMYAIVEVTS